MRKINKLNIIRIITLILFSFYITFNGVDIKIGNFRFYINSLTQAIKSEQ